MPQPLDEALTEVRDLLLAPDLTRAVAAGRRRGLTPSVTRAELRPVTLKGGARLQIVTDDGSRPFTRNVAPGDEASAAIDELLAEPFGNWHVETSSVTLQLRVTKKGDAQVHRASVSAAPASTGAASTASASTAQDHDRQKQWLLDPGDPLFQVIGGNAAKRRQIDAFLRALAATLPDELPSPLRVVDLGCGNAYLTFAAYRYLAGRGVQVQVVGVDVREDQRVRNTAVAASLGCADDVTFVAGTIEEAALPFEPDLVLALHACDTATDQALARAVGWKAQWTLAAPCCHHDIAAQLKGRPAPAPFGELTRHAIMRERFADVLTDSLRAALLRLNGYKVEVVEFIDSAHTPRNLLLRARRTDAAPTAAQQSEYEALTSQWGVTPALEKMLP
ncbi:class I SAM-dependent methyltransferase [Actinoplanes solisilvae]|uniref:class I SAM-dependent methyltransferase n=1 Tax=Actinoplanes solisilvae TaxID=2486853 RepID=UPI000FD7B108|nr:SAM-dependent methyltransferase [Actinoplanes solisilvae]